MEMLFDDKDNLIKKVMEVEKDLSVEFFQDYFESEHAERKSKKQDFTPLMISKLASMLVGNSDKYFESCAGNGSMMIQFWNNNKDAYFEIEEMSDRSLPFLIFNMSVRKMSGHVKHCDSLTQEIKAEYELKNGNIEVVA